MEEKENFKGNRMLLTIIGLSILVVATIGATFAYFSATSKAVIQNITTGELKVDATSSVASNSNIKPTKWISKEDANTNDDIAKVTLTVNTSGTTIDTGTYDIDLTTTGIKLKDKYDNEEDGRTLEGGKLSDVKWALYKNDAGEDETLTNGEVAKGDFGKTDDANATENNFVNQKLNTTAIKIAKGGSTDTYTLYIWIENTEDEEGSPGSGKQDKLQQMNITATLRVTAKQ